jgi:transcription termination factor Rho
MKRKTVRVPIFHGYVEVAEEKYNRMVENGELDAYKKLFEPKSYGGASVSVGNGGSTHIIAGARRQTY